MSYLEKLLEGVDVERKGLGEIAIKISSGGTPNTGVSTYYKGNIPWLRTQEVGSGDIWDTGIKITELGLKNSSAKIIPKNCVIVAMYGATVGKIGINKIPLCTNQACANIQLDEEVAHYRYVYHYLLSQYEFIKSLGAGSQTNINAQIVKKLQIPIPPLSVQKEIVRILDAFTELTTELTIELTARKQQYIYYRDQLLSFEGGEVEWKSLGDKDFFEVSSGGTPLTSNKEYWDGGNIPWLKSESCNNESVYSAKNFITELGLKKSSAKLLNKDTTLIALVGATIFKTAYLEFQATTNQNIASIKSLNPKVVNDKFVFYFITNLYEVLKSEMRNYGMLNLTKLRQFKIPIPPLEEQERIVSILDKFDSLTNSISEGLPKEIELRKKQYEYYREMLLTFPQPESV